MGKITNNNAGYSLAEVIIAVGIGAVVLVAAGKGITLMSSGAKKLAEKSSTDFDSKNVSVNFTATIEAADIAANFQHLPIRTSGCSSERLPCLRELKGDSFAEAPTGAPIARARMPAALEFFRDHDARIIRTPAFGSASTTQLQGTAPVSLPMEALQGNYHVTWPLVDEKSPALVVLRNAGTGDYLTFRMGWETSAALAHRYVFFQASNDSVKAENIRGNLLLVFNKYNLSHYVFQLATDAIDCTKTQRNPSTGKYESLCRPMAYFLGSNPTPTQVDQVDQELKNPANRYFALELKPASASSRFKTSYIPPLASIGAQEMSQVSWPGQDADFYSFATEAASFVETVGPEKIDFDPPGSVDVRRLAHFFTLKQDMTKALLMAVPVKATAYYLRANKTAVDPETGNTIVKSRSLVSSTFYHYSPADLASSTVRGDFEVRLVEEVGGTVVVARRLGTSSFGFYLYRGGSGGMSRVPDPGAELHRYSLLPEVDGPAFTFRF